VSFWGRRKQRNGDNAETDQVRILSIDGGGVRGLIPAVILAKLEEVAQRSAAELFDLVAGTSTGALIALGTVRPGEPRRAERILQLYTDRAAGIFGKKQHRLLPRKPLPFSPYDSQALSGSLDDLLGESLLSESTVPLLVPAYDLRRRRPYWFRSWAARDSRHDFLMRDVGLAACAAPTYFRPHRVTPTDERTAGFVFCDGGIFANNPSLEAWKTALELFPGREVLVVSLGTGDLTSGGAKDEADWNAFDWAKHGLDTLFDANSGYVDHVMKRALADRYVRVQPKLAEEVGKLDATSDGEIAELLDTVRTEREDLIRRGFFTSLRDELCKGQLERSAT
jgi:patatin-like phospholipase/acyl hydrolase